MSDNPFNNVDLFLDLSGSADIGLDEIANALTTGIRADVGLANVGVTVAGAVDVGLSNVNADLGLNDIRINNLPTVRVEAAITELPVIRTDSKLDAKIDAGLDDIRINALPPIQLEFSMRPLRVHLPLNYSFCIELFGIRLFKFSLCGEGMVVTEDYKPRDTERCG